VQATVGGNVACNKSCGDLLPSLVALDSIVLLTAPAGDREVPIAELVRTPDRSALITALRVPRLGPSGRVARQRFARSANDLATINVALALRIEGGAVAEPRLAVGGVAPTVLRIAAAERELAGARVDGGPGAVATLAERLAKAVARAVEPIDDLRGSAAFKRELAGTLAGRALETCIGSRGGAR
jgi:CO/xanthine dehydrogenase FAD-binding subunit